MKKLGFKKKASENISVDLDDVQIVVWITSNTLPNDSIREVLKELGVTEDYFIEEFDEDDDGVRLNVYGEAPQLVDKWDEWLKDVELLVRLSKTLPPLLKMSVSLAY